MNDEELELARAEAMKADRCFSKDGSGTNFG